MGPNPSKTFYTERSKVDRRKQNEGIRKFFYVQDRTGATFEIVVPDDTLTCGWLLSETIRTVYDPNVVALETRNSNEFQDFYLNCYEKNLTEIKDKELLRAVYMTPPQDEAIGKHCFTPVKVIGKGGYSRVLMVRSKATGDIYAMKTISKQFVEMKGKVQQIYTELEVLTKVNSPFVVDCHYAFASKNHLHFILDFCPGGELFFHMHNLGRFTERQARFYFAEIVMGICDLHRADIAYRDLKPENILLDVDGHIKLTDFGLSKTQMRMHTRTYSFWGSPEYISPEMLRNQGHDRSVDFYSLGALLYEMLTGLPPFYTTNRKQMYTNIQFSDLRVPDYISKSAKSLLVQLLTKDPARRLGYLQGFDEIRHHAWCRRIDWNAMYRKKVRPPFKLATNYSNFDPEYTSTPLLDEDYNMEGDPAESQYSNFVYSKPSGFRNSLLPADYNSQVPKRPHRSHNQSTITVTATSTDQSVSVLSVQSLVEERKSINSGISKTPVKKIPKLQAHSGLSPAVFDTEEVQTDRLPESASSVEPLSAGSPDKIGPSINSIQPISKNLKRNAYVDESSEIEVLRKIDS